MNLKRIIQDIKWKPTDFVNKIEMKCRHIQYGNSLCTRGRIFIRGKGRILIGNNVTINSCIEANPIGGDTRSVFHSKEGAVIIIGNNVGISNAAIVAMDHVVIEDDVFIGGSCKIYDHDFHSVYYSKRMLSSNEDVVSRPVIIKKGAFIGGHCIILKGVTIGEKSVIGAGSVVSRSIPDGEIWAGNPARFIKRIMGENYSNEEVY